MLLLDSRAADFADAFESLLHMKRETDEDVNATVAAIINDVRHRGDLALVEYTAKFDRLPHLTPAGLAITADEVDAALAQVSPELMAALELAAERITDFHRRQVPQGYAYTDAAGVRLGQRWTAVQAAGLYVPGGTAAYPSSVLMNAIPAKVAGVERLVMVVPKIGRAHV